MKNDKIDKFINSLSTSEKEVLKFKLLDLENEKISNIINSLSIKEKEALKAVFEPIYFADNSDYLAGLWNVVRAILGREKSDEVHDIDVQKWLYALDPEIYADDESENV